jgi:hypothetical protein
MALPEKVGTHEWACAVGVTGAGLRIADTAHGADALQAVQLAFELARQILVGSGLRLSWGEPTSPKVDFSGEVGFLRLVPFFAGPNADAYAARIDRYIARQGRLALRESVARHAAGKGAKRRRVRSRSGPYAG